MNEAVPSEEAQLREIRAIEKTERLTVGTQAFLIDHAWLRNWKICVNYYPGYGRLGERPGPIDNTTFLDEDGSVKAMACERQDYEIVTAGVWKKLLEWYGGGPEVAADVVQDDSSGEAVARVEKWSLKLVYDGETTPIRCFKLMKVKELRQLAMERLGLPAEKETRLIDWWSGKFTKLMDDADDLSVYHITAGQEILLDEKDANGEWKHKDPIARTTYDDIDDGLYPTSQRLYGANSIYNRNGVSYGVNYYGGGSRNYGAYPGPGRVGLSNMGNTCFFNSGVQCLMHTMPLMNVFLNSDWESAINESNRLGTSGKVVRAFGELVKHVWKGQWGVVEPSDLKYQIGKFAPQFSGWQQQDSHELITFMLDAIHEDLNRCQTKPQVEAVNGDSTDEEAMRKVAEAAWDNHRLRNDSIIVDSFHGQLRSRLKCPECHKNTIVFDPYVSIPLPLQKTQLQKVKAVFIPLDMNKAKADVVINLPYSPSPSDVSKAMTELIGREVTAVIATVRSTNAIEWGVPEDDGYYQRNFFIFEIDDTSKFWVPCVVTMTIYNEWMTYTDEEIIVGPFVMPFDRELLSTDEIAEACERKLSWLWDAPIPEQAAERACEPESPTSSQGSDESDEDRGGMRIVEDHTMEPQNTDEDMNEILSEDGYAGPSQQDGAVEHSGTNPYSGTTLDIGGSIWLAPPPESTEKYRDYGILHVPDESTPVDGDGANEEPTPNSEANDNVDEKSDSRSDSGDRSFEIDDEIVIQNPYTGYQAFDRDDNVPVFPAGDESSNVFRGEEDEQELDELDGPMQLRESSQSSSSSSWDRAWDDDKVWDGQTDYQAETNTSYNEQGFTGNDEGLTEEERKLKRRFVRPRDSYGNGVRMCAKVHSVYGQSAYLGRDKNVAYMANKLVILTMSGDYAVEEEGFNINEIVRRFEEPHDTYKRDTGPNGVMSLDKCFEFFSSNEVLDEQNQWFCPNCRKFVCAEKQMGVWSVPDILIIQLKRFITGTWSTKKIEDEISYPDILDMSKYLVGPQKDSSQLYKLFAVSEHMGGLGGGHYIAHAVVQDKNGVDKWYEFNDSQVHEADRASAHTRLAYVLFYIRDGAENANMRDWIENPEPDDTHTDSTSTDDTDDTDDTDTTDSSDQELRVTV